MSEFNQPSKRVHPWRWAEEYGKQAVQVFDVKPMAVNPLWLAQTMAKNPGRPRPTELAEWVAKGGY